MNTTEIQAGDSITITFQGETTPYKVIKAGPKVLVLERTGTIGTGIQDKFYRATLAQMAWAKA